MRKEQHLSRRQLIAKSATLAAASIIPRHVLGGLGHISPSDQLHVAIIARLIVSRRCTGAGELVVVLKLLYGSGAKGLGHSTTDKGPTV